MTKNSCFIIIFLQIFISSFCISCNSKLVCKDDCFEISKSIGDTLDLSIGNNIIVINYSKKDFPIGLTCNELHKNYREIIAKKKGYSTGSRRQDMRRYSFRSLDSSIVAIKALWFDSTGKYGKIILKPKQDGIARILAEAKDLSFISVIKVENGNIITSGCQDKVLK